MRDARETPVPQAMREAEFFSHELDIDLIQSPAEGIDLRSCADLIRAVSAMPPGIEKERAADTVYDLIRSAKKIRGYAYREPSDRDGDFSLCEGGYADKQAGASARCWACCWASAAIGEAWIAPLHGKLQTSIVEVGTIEIDRLANHTMNTAISERMTYNVENDFDVRHAAAAPV